MIGNDAVQFSGESGTNAAVIAYNFEDGVMSSESKNEAKSIRLMSNGLN